MTTETVPDISLGQVIEELGHEVHVTYAGDQALAVAATFRPDLMLIDLAMPHIDGCDLVRRFRQNPDFAQKKIVAITGHADQKSAAIDAGFDAVHLKPITLTATLKPFWLKNKPARHPGPQLPSSRRDRRSVLR